MVTASFGYYKRLTPLLVIIKPTSGLAVWGFVVSDSLLGHSSFFTLELNQFFFTETNGKKKLGGCATVAGWGHRYSLDGSEATHDGESSCMTDFSDASVDKVK